MTENILEEVNPNGNIQAVVEQDERVAFFHLYGSDEIDFGVKSCWVRNLTEAPDAPGQFDIEQETRPLLHKDACTHPQGLESLEPDLLQVVWFEEGNGAALFSDNQMLAVIPPSSGEKGFNGYARDCRGKTPICWELGSPDRNTMFSRVEKAQSFWQSWEREDSPWEGLPEQCVDAYTRQLGQYSNYFAIDGGYWPPKGMVRIPIQNGGAFLTVGMCLRPQPNVEPGEPCRRIELGFCMEGQTENLLPEAPGFVSSQSGIPWESYNSLKPYDTLPCHAIPGAHGGPEFSAMLLMPAPLNAPKLQLPTFLGDPVTLLWMIPITQKELIFSQKANPRELARRLTIAGHGWPFQYRAELPL